LVSVSYAATLLLFVLANRLTTSANAIFLQATAPLYLLLLGPWLLREPITRRDLGLMAALAIGMACFFLGQQTPYLTAPDPTTGNLLATVSGFTWALTMVGLRNLGKHGGSPQAVVMSGNVVACLWAAPFALPLGPHALADWLVVAYLGIFQIGVAYVLVSAAVSLLPAFEVTLLLYLEPALNPVWSWMVHGERPGLLALVGGAIILTATFLKVVASRDEG
jgi:drug/metabolite transporter (DMT)-like permease